MQPSCSQRFLQEYQLSDCSAAGPPARACSQAAASAFSRSTSSQRLQRSAASLQPAPSPGVPALRLQRSRASSPSLQASCSQRTLQEYHLQTAAQRSEPVASDFSRSVSSETQHRVTDCSAAQQACSQCCSKGLLPVETGSATAAVRLVSRSSLQPGCPSHDTGWKYCPHLIGGWLQSIAAAVASNALSS
jgi:hypothetical protein